MDANSRQSLRSRALAAARWFANRPILLLSALGRATVRRWPLFVVRELSGRSDSAAYRLRSSGVLVVIRHGTADSATLSEIFYLGYYDVDDEVARAIGVPRRILDLGANVGLFGAYAAGRWPGARIVGYEPEPDNAAVHERTIEINGLEHRWNVVRAAARAKPGVTAFAAGLGVNSHVIDSDEDGEQPSVNVEGRDVLPEIAAADLVKVDIEGGEWEILGDRRLCHAPPRVLVMEYHPRMCPTRDPREAAEGALRKANMRTAEIWHRDDDGHGMLWAWRG